MSENYMLELEDRLNAKTKELLFLEAEVERLRGELELASDICLEAGNKHVNNVYQVSLLQAENARLKAVAEAARGVFLGEGEHLCSEFEDAMDRLEQALVELDKEPSHD